MIITNGSIVTWTEPNQILEGHEILVDGGKIMSIEPAGVLRNKYPEEELLDAQGQLILPGNICAHTHFYGAFSRGMAIPGEPAENFQQILEKLWWKLDKALDEEGTRYSALTLLIDAIKYGTTTIIDHHASPNFIDGSLDVVYEAVRKAGLRSALCYEVTDRDGKERALAGIRENSRFISRVIAGETDPLVKAHFGLHASLTVSEETLEKCVIENENRVGFHVHAAEGVVDQEDSLAKYGERVVERFWDRKVLNDRSILAHGVHLSENEVRLLAESRSWLTHQPRSNMNNAVGVAPIEKLLASGVNVCLGNDGFSNAMWQEWFFTYLLQKDRKGDPRAMNGYDVIKIAVHNNSDLATQIWDGLRVGTIEPGAAADIIFVDYHPITPMNTGNLPWHILFGFRDGMVTMTMAGGKVLMKDRQLLFLDEAEIAAKSREVAAHTWAKVAEM
ncbi:MAG: putative aminohydrolase SsnA [Anaerolineaceae bacterium]|jgi:putative selenium metabolism protein SsnA|nr:putative aminohydrolase SsnA [Anaerolineaceae bacterium]MDD4041904.1 putative aminohydrolase SsnA [Anaerolineaceae bacterium]